MSCAQHTTSLALAGSGRRSLADSPLCRRHPPLQRVSRHRRRYHTFDRNVPMACLYSPYSRSRIADGGFCDPVRILLTVLSAWLKTLSVFLYVNASVSKT